MEAQQIASATPQQCQSILQQVLRMQMCSWLCAVGVLLLLLSCFHCDLAPEPILRDVFSQLDKLQLCHRDISKVCLCHVAQ